MAKFNSTTTCVLIRCPVFILHHSVEGNSSRKLICFKLHVLWTSRPGSDVCEMAATEEMIAKLWVLRKRYFQDTVFIALKIPPDETLRPDYISYHFLMPFEALLPVDLQCTIH